MAGAGYVAIAIFCGLSAGVIGRIKGSSFLIWFVVGTVLPLFGTIAALFYRRETYRRYVNCPECYKRVPVHQQVCTRCGRDLDYVFGEPEPTSSGSEPGSPGLVG
jgi:hypothetical protein